MSSKYSEVIHGDRYAIKWVPNDKDRGAVLQWFTKGRVTLAGFSLDIFILEDIKA